MGSKLRCGHERKVLPDVLPDVLPENGEQIVVNGCREQLYPTTVVTGELGRGPSQKSGKKILPKMVF